MLINRKNRHEPTRRSVDERKQSRWQCGRSSVSLLICSPHQQEQEKPDRENNNTDQESWWRLDKTLQQQQRWSSCGVCVEQCHHFAQFRPTSFSFHFCFCFFRLSDEGIPCASRNTGAVIFLDRLSGSSGRLSQSISTQSLDFFVSSCWLFQIVRHED